MHVLNQNNIRRQTLFLYHIVHFEISGCIKFSKQGQEGKEGQLINLTVGDQGIF